MQQKTRRADRVILALWIVGFVVGTASHVLDVLAGGLSTYGEFPTPLRVFWGSLLVVDPIVVCLLATRRRAGVVLALVVILADIAVNWTVWLTISGNPLWGMINQTLFAALLVVTAPRLWRWFGARTSRTAPVRGSR
ncbi:MAG: hypothetical protein QM713_07735 [Arachnia sp.]